MIKTQLFGLASTLIPTHCIWYDMAILIGSEVGVDRVSGIQLLVPLPKAGEHLDEARVTSVVMASKQEPWVVRK